LNVGRGEMSQVGVRTSNPKYVLLPGRMTLFHDAGVHWDAVTFVTFQYCGMTASEGKWMVVTQFTQRRRTLRHTAAGPSLRIPLPTKYLLRSPH
jgi:hypothetical protein